MADGTCEVDGCSKAPRSPRSALCNAHYFRKRRTGNTGTAQVSDRKPTPCSIAECPEWASARGLCTMHYQRVKAHGSPHTVLPNPSGVANWNWKGDDVGYGAAHDRVRRAHGPASQHACAGCGAEAKHWAYDHGDPDECTSKWGPYSPDLERYLPMCVSCHKTFDLAHIGASA